MPRTSKISPEDRHRINKALLVLRSFLATLLFIASNLLFYKGGRSAGYYGLTLRKQGGPFLLAGLNAIDYIGYSKPKEGIKWTSKSFRR